MRGKINWTHCSGEVTLKGTDYAVHSDETEMSGLLLLRMQTNDSNKQKCRQC